MSLKHLQFSSKRQWGVELEYRSFDKRDFKRNPLGDGEVPAGAVEIQDIIAQVAGTNRCALRRWEQTHNNTVWVVKTDSSCGIEVCSPVLCGWDGLKHVLGVVDALSQDKRIVSDELCGLHLHVGIKDFTERNESFHKLLRTWIKCEPVFLDSVPECRKTNWYCRMVAFDPSLRMDSNPSLQTLQQIFKYKYLTCNLHHWANGRRATMEFRIAEGAGCLNPFLIKNWVRLLLHFTESVLRFDYKTQTEPHWDGVLWLDFDDVMKVLGFDGSCELSPGLIETRNWFVSRVIANLENNSKGIMSSEARKISRQQAEVFAKEFGIKPQLEVSSAELFDASKAI